MYAAYAGQRSPAVNVCTVTIRRRLPYARVLAESFLAHHPTGSLTALVIDGPLDEQLPEGFHTLAPSDIGISDPELHTLAMLLDLEDLTMACIPRLLKHLTAKTERCQIYLADDVRIFSPIGRLNELVEERSLVLSPRAHTALPDDGLSPDQAQLLDAGLYNPGLVGVGPRSTDFLNWWIDAMQAEARRNLPSAAVMVDSAQPRAIRFNRILDMAGLFDHLKLDRRLGLTSFWNIWDRQLDLSGDIPRLDGNPLGMFRFEGFNPELPHLLASSQGPRPRVLFSEWPQIARLADDYTNRLIDFGLEEASKSPACFEHLPGGLKVDRRMRFVYRKTYKEHLEGLAPSPPDPFGESDPENFVDWLNSADERSYAPAVPRYLLALYEERLDLKAAFPGLAHADAGRYLDWVVRYGAREAAVSPELCRFDQSTRRSPADDLAESAAPGTLRRRGLLPAGLNVAGYFKAESGVGEMARLVLNGVQCSGIAYSSLAYQARFSRQNHPFEGTGDPFAYGVNLLCVNADELYPFVRDIGARILDNRYNVGLWWWELEELPQIGPETEALVDEIWVGTQHVAKAVRARTSKPVLLVPVPIRTVDAEPDRASLGIPDGFMFLFTFDFLSAFARKNPLGVIEAFSKAFSPNEGPVLVIKSINGTAEVAAQEVLRLAAKGRDDIMIIDTYLEPERKDALIASCDCYVSLHRAEGYGLGMAEAAALGKPVISTGYSGNLEFLNHNNSYLVGYEVSTVPPGTGPYREGATWAEPDTDEAASTMRHVYLNQQEAAERGRLARHEARTIHTPQRTAQFITDRIAQIRQIQIERQKEDYRRQIKAGLTRRLGFQGPGSGRNS